MEQVLFDILIKDTKLSGTECTLKKFADDTTLSDAVETFEKGAFENPMSFDKAKCKALHVG